MTSRNLFAGCSEIAITPPLGVSIAGYYYDRRADNILDDLNAHALVLSSGGLQVALVVCDLISLKREVTLPIRQSIARRTGIPVENVLICCTHTHTGPVTSPWPEVNLYPDEAYLDVLERKIADAVVLAARRLRPARAWVGGGRVEGIAFNRRYWMKDGSLQTNPAFQSPDILRPAGPLDPELGLLLVRYEDGAPLALWTNYALHPDQVDGTALSADYEGVMSRLLKEALGQQCTILSTNGCAGDINHFDMTKPGPQKEYACAEYSGKALAEEAIRRLPEMVPVGEGSLLAGSQMVSVPLRVPAAEEVAWASQISGETLTDFTPHALDIVRADRILAVHRGGKTHLQAEVNALKLGEWTMVGLPGEVFSQLGLDIKERSPYQHTFIAELCNDDVDYVPPRQVYDEGGYEAASSRFAPGAGELLVDAALAMLAGLR